MNFLNRIPERIRTVIIWAPIPILMLVASKFSAWLLFATLTVMAVWEWRKIIISNSDYFYSRLTQIAIFGAILGMIFALVNVWAALIVTLIVSLAVSIKDNPNRRLDIFLSQMIPSLVGIGAYIVRSENQGLALFGLMLVITVFSDSAAYFVGKAIGKRKFAPKISPNKTWEGVVGGWVFAIIAAWIYCAYFIPEINEWNGLGKLLFFWCLAFAGQLGDLGESAVKRKYGVKDSGDLFPGHGGVMDRFDSFAGVILVMGVMGLFVAL